ncbi:MAG TPA: hypothetical protein EYN89_09290, partial [Flavobacteriales bacterium]|nr:hypothetical protein [Flavobacteriales bacterium]
MKINNCQLTLSLVILMLTAPFFVEAQNDFLVLAPYNSPLRSTCGAGNDCSLQSTEEHIYKVNILTSGTWTFSLCGSSFDTWIYVGSSLCSNDIGNNDDFCSTRSEVTAAITAGTYYVTIEGYSGCGNYILNISGPPADSTIIFQKAFGGSQLEEGYDIIQTADGGYMLTGFTNTFGPNYYDACLIKTDNSGSIEWSKAYGKASSGTIEKGHSVEQTNDGGYIICGESNGYGAGSYDYYLVRTDSIGDTMWTNVYGGSQVDRAYDVMQTNDGGFVIAGETRSFGVNSNYSALVVRTDPNGDTLWAKTYGSASSDYGYSIKQTADQGFILVGKSGYNNVLLVKTNSSGDTLWTKQYGGSDLDQGNDVLQTIDGGYIILGETKSFGAGGRDIYVIRIDGSGSLLWSKTYGGTLDDFGNSIQTASDGGYIISGYTSSFGNGSTDAYIISINSTGGLLWSKVFGGTGADEGFGALKSSDGGYVLGGRTRSFGEGNYDALLIKTNKIGNSSLCTQNEAVTIVNNAATIISPTIGVNVFAGCDVNNTNSAGPSVAMVTGDIACANIKEKYFQKIYGGSGFDIPYSVQQTEDDGYMLSGYTGSFGSGNSDFYVVKTDTNGVVEWSRAYGESTEDRGRTIMQTTDGGYIQTGDDQSQALLIKTNGIGDTVWVLAYGGSGSYDVGYSVKQTNDGGYIVAGWTWSFGAGGYDMYVVKVDAIGNLLWSKTYGGSQHDKAYSIEQTTDNGFIITGETSSFGSGLTDIYVIRTDENGDTLWTRTFGGANDDYGYSVKQIADGNFLIVGYTSSFGAGGEDAYLIKIDVNGDIIWSKTYGHSGDDKAYDVIQEFDGGFVISGTRWYSGSGNEMFLIKTDEMGDTVWVRAYEDATGGYSVAQTSDRGYVTVGYTNDFGPGFYFRLIKTDANGFAGDCFQGGGGFLVSSSLITQVNPASLTGSASTIISSKSPIAIDPPTFESELLITTDIDGANISCNGGGDGSIDLTKYGGMGPYTFQWSSSHTTEDIVNVPIGTYSVIITDDNGCEALDTITLSEPTILTNSISGTNISCNGGNDGEAMVTAAGGTPPYNYFWSMGQITSTAIGLYPGTYTINVTDNNGCPGTNIITLTEPDPLSSIITATDATCIGGNGTADLSVSGGTSPYTYAWSNGEITEDITGIVEGIYHVTITDSCANMFVDSIFISEPPAIITSIIDADVSCNGFGNGEADLSVSGGTLPYSYLWSNTATTQDVSSLSPNTYYVTVTDGCGISVSDTIEISEPAILTTIMSSTDVTCNGGGDGTATVTASGGTSPYNYMWNTGQSTSTAVSLFPGNHLVNIFDANGCLASNAISISQPSSLASSIVGTDVTCIAGSNGAADLAVSGGTLPYTYAWSNTTNTEDLSNISSGTYIVTITDSCSFVLIDSIAITEPPALISTIVVSDISCNGNDDGVADLSVSGGTQPYSYLWSNSETTEDIGSLDTGTYTVNIIDACSAVLVDTAILTEPAVLTTTMTSTSVNCYSGGNGTATVTPSGGTAPYNYLWNNGQVTATAVGLFPGNYTVNVTDVNGCLTSDIINIAQPPMLSANISSSVNVVCVGNATGSAVVSATGGTPPYNYLWNDVLSQTTDTASGLMAGNYTVLVTDSCGANTTQIITITEPIAMTLLLSQDNVSCNGYMDGSAAASVTGGTAPFTYLWPITGDSTSSILGLDTGLHILVVTSSCGNTITDSIIITEPAVLTTTMTGTDVNCYGGGDGTAMVIAGGGIGPYNYLWSNGQVNGTAIGLFPGSYTVNVTDLNGCLTSDIISITQPSPLSATTSSTDVSCMVGNDGTASVNASGGTLPYSYNWMPSGDTIAILNNLAEDTYYITLTDSCGATIIDSVVVGGPSSMNLNLVAMDISCNGFNDGSVDLSVISGTQPLTFAWSTGATTEDVSGLSPGMHIVTVTDSCGTSLSDSVLLIEPTVLTTVISLSDVNCYGGGDGIATVTVSGGTAPYNYLWNNGQVNATAVGLFAGTYTVNITDFNGCLTSDIITITEPSALSIGLSIIDATCGESDGSAEAAVTGGTSPYTYTWTSGGTSSTDTALVGGTYSLTVSDTNGCMDSVDVLIPISALVQEICIVTV